MLYSARHYSGSVNWLAYRRRLPFNDQWNYERGRQWARQAPPTVALKRNGKLTDEAVPWYTDDII
jgi:hypothetical protein